MPMIAIAGCDGAGKSTLVRNLAAALADRGFETEIVDKWDIFDAARYPECAFLAGGPARLKQCVSSMDGVARALFIFWMISLPLKRLRGGGADKVYLLDGYWMKHAAAEILLGCPPEVVLAAVNALPAADQTFFLDVSPATASGRKQSRSRYECGRGSESSPTAFSSHQSKVSALLSEWADERGWVRVDSEATRESILNEALERILGSLRLAPETVLAAG
jgi:thymidylate kinase